MQYKPWLIATLFLSVSIAVLIAALAGLPLFQDGAYLFVMNILKGTYHLPHNRFSGFIFQSPLVLMQQTGMSAADLKFFFTIGYALVPLLSLSASWLVVRKTAPQLMIWPTLVILYLNTVNFSWVSELLITMQFTCPLLLALIVAANQRLFWLSFIILSPLLFLLHPLAAISFFFLALTALFQRWQSPDKGRGLLIIAALFGLLSFSKLLLFYLTGPGYEKRFLNIKMSSSYFFSASIEDYYLLLSAVIIAVLLVLYHKISAKLSVLIISCCYSLLGLALLLNNLSQRFSVLPLLASIFILTCIAYLIFKRLSATKPFLESLYHWLLIALPLIAVSALLSQYLTHGIVLKTGFTYILALIIYAAAVLDYSLNPPAHSLLRQSLSVYLAVIYLVCISVKAVLWMGIQTKLMTSIHQNQALCIEKSAPSLAWLKQYPGSKINNWALPSLAIASQLGSPIQLLVQGGKCQQLIQNKKVHLASWAIVDFATVDEHFELLGE